MPGGFGYRGIPGKIEAIRHARERQIPFFGICLGLQCAVIEFARNVLGLEDANTTEIAPNCRHPVVCLLNEQYNITHLGGTMRLGLYPCVLQEDSRAGRPMRPPRSRNGTGTAMSSTTSTASSSPLTAWSFRGPVRTANWSR